MVGKNRQQYFDRLIVELSAALDHLVAFSKANWFFFMNYEDGVFTLRDNFLGYRVKVENLMDDFVIMFSEFIANVKAGLPDIDIKGLQK